MVDAEGVPRPVERTTAAILKDIIAGVQEIVRAEVHLARTEIKEEAAEAAKAAIRLGAGTVLCLYSTGFALLAAVYGLALVMPPALAALLVSVVVGFAAGLLITQGRKRWKKVHPKPEKTITSIKENIAWVKNQTK